MSHTIAVEEVQEEISEAIAKISGYTAQERDDAVESVRASIEQIDSEIEVLENRAREEWADMSQEAKDRTANVMQTLRERRNRLGEMYGAMSQGTESAWDDLVAGFRQAWDDLKTAWNDAVTESKSNGNGE